MQTLFFMLIMIIAITAAVFLSINNRVKIIYFFLFMIVFQNIIVILFCENIPPLFNTIFSSIKEVMLYIALIFTFIKRGTIKLSKGEYASIACLIIYLIMISKNFFVTTAQMSSAILSLRYMLVPILCIYVGRNILIKREEYEKLLRYIVLFALVLSAFGIVEMFILGDSFWTTIGYSEYAVKIKGNPAFKLINGVTINFYTWDFFSIPIRRLVSITADPLATAFLIYLGALILITGSIPLRNARAIKSDKIFALCILFIASILSLSKAVFVLIGLTVLLCAYFYRWLPKTFLLIATVVFAISFFLILNSYVGSSDAQTSSSSHVAGLVDGLLQAGLFGNGLGTAGISVSMLTGSESSVAESYIGVLFAQVGYIGGCAFLLYFLLQIVKMASLYRMYKDNSIVLALVCLIGVIVCAILSESAISIMGTGIYFIIVGIVQQRYSRKKTSIWRNE